MPHCTPIENEFEPKQKYIFSQYIYIYNILLNLIMSSFVVTMRLDEGLSHVQSQKKPRLHFGEFHFKLNYTFHSYAS